MVGSKRVSTQLKLFYAIQHKAGNLRPQQAQSASLMSRSTALRALREYERTGTVKKQRIGTGRPSKGSAGVKAWVVGMVKHRPGILLDELRRLLRRYLGTEVSKSTVYRWLEKAGISFKKLSRAARQRDEDRRTNFALEMARYQPEQLLFADETHFNKRNGLRLYGWAPAGQRASVEDDLGRGGRWTLLPALGLDGLVAPYIVEGSITQERFAFWVEHFLLPTMSPFPGPRSVLVLDNASVHKDEHIRDLLTGHGCHLIFLPAYSPDFNPIELAFSALKSRLRRQESATSVDVLKACDQIRDAHARAYFRSCGYGPDRHQ